MDADLGPLLWLAGGAAGAAALLLRRPRATPDAHGGDAGSVGKPAAPRILTGAATPPARARHDPGRGGRPGTRATLVGLGSAAFMDAAAPAEGHPVALRLNGRPPIVRQPLAQLESCDERVVAVSADGDLFEASSGAEGERPTLRLCLALANEKAFRGARIVSIACGPSHCAAVAANGDLFCWGGGAHGRLGHGDECDDEPAPRKVQSLLHLRVQHVACGGEHTLCTTRDGDLFAWGRGDSGQLGHRNADGVTEPRRVLTVQLWSAKPGQGPFETRKFVQVAAGRAHSVFVDSKGDVFCCGQAGEGQCGPTKDRVNATVPCPRKVDGLAFDEPDKVVSVRAGGDVSMALTATGKLFTWGCGRFGELGRPGVPNGGMPGQVLLRDAQSGQDLPVVAASCGTYHAAAVVADGRVFAWGRDEIDSPPGTNPKQREAAPHEHEQLVSHSPVPARQSEAHALWEPRPISLPSLSAFRARSPEKESPASHTKTDSGPARKHSTLVSCGKRFTLIACSRLDEPASPAAANDPPTTPQSIACTPVGPREPSTVRAESEQLDAGRQHAYKWLDRILPRWKAKRTSKTTLVLWRSGVPTSVRPHLWPRAIGNPLKITPQLYAALKRTALSLAADPGTQGTCRFAFDALPLSVGHENATGDRTDRIADHETFESVCAHVDADLPRTFPTLGLFKADGPLGEQLRSVLLAFAVYRPDLGYVQGMSYLAAVVCLNSASEVAAFQCFANLLTQGHLFAFFRLERKFIYEYYDIFERSLADYGGTRAIGSQLAEQQIHPHLFAFNWFQTLFLKVLPLRVAVRAMDCYLLDGSQYIMRLAVAVVFLFRDRICGRPFEDCIKLLSCSPGQEEVWQEVVTEEALFSAADSIKLHARLLDELEDLNCRVEFSP